MITKNFYVGEALWKIPFRIFLNKVFALKALLSGDAESFIAVFKAHFHYLNWLMFQTTKSIYPAKKNKSLHGYFKGLIVWQYFINKKRIFSEIVKTKN